MKNLNAIFDKLDMDRKNGLYWTTENKWKDKLPARVGYLLKDKLKPDAFFCIDNKPIVLFYNSPQNRKELFKAVWNFNESPVVIINEPDTVEIFNGLSYLKDKKSLEILEDQSNLNAFSYFELVTGKTWQAYEDNLKYQNRVDFKLLENIKAARNILIEKYEVDNYLANALIGKCIFIRYLIDRKVKINFDGKLREWSNDELCELLKDKKKTIEFLKYLKKRFNGEAFLIEDSALEKIHNEAFNILSSLMKGEKIPTGQWSLFDIYDFSIIPVEFISNVYEHFIGEETQAKKGAYYTPLFLVNYIIKETVEKYFEANKKEYNCKILDPACGSGIFLVEALRRMIERYQKIEGTNSIDNDILKKIAEENIYGIDQDKNAINVALFSVYLALLDYKEPKEIENFEFPELINKNFFTNDFFDINAKFNNIIKEKKIEFDFILGNPPWKCGGNKKSLFVQYIKYREKRESDEDKPKITISDYQIAQAFLLRTSDFSTTKTKCALIVTSKILYNLSRKAKDFRKYLLHNYFIDRVFELAPVRREVFDKSNDPSINPAAILFFHYADGKSTEKKVIEHIALKPNRFFSLFKVFMLQRNDYKKVVQSRLIEYDWLWKILVYGTYLDFNLIKRLKTEYKNILDIIEGNEYLKGQGIIIKGSDKNDVSYLLNKVYLDTRKDVKQFHTNINPNNIWTQKYVYRTSNKDLFRAPILLIKGGINKRLESISAISYKNCIFKSSLTGIKFIDLKKLNVLKIINGLLNSNLFSYHILQTGSSAGIEREESQDEEKFSFPYIDNLTIAEYVEKIEAISKKLFQEEQKPLNPDIQPLTDEKKKLINKLNDEILNSFDLNEQEEALVDYAVKITIPLIIKHKDYENKLFSPLNSEDPFLKKYADVFLQRFQDSFKRRNKKFTIQIQWSKYIIGMFFKVTDETNNNKPISVENKTEKDLISTLLILGNEKITESLFIQKDIHGFEKDGFYVIKPNEKKLWHKAVAYLDSEEFADAMLREGGKEKQND